MWGRNFVYSDDRYARCFSGVYKLFLRAKAPGRMVYQQSGPFHSLTLLLPANATGQLYSLRVAGLLPSPRTWVYCRWNWDIPSALANQWYLQDLAEAMPDFSSDLPEYALLGAEVQQKFSRQVAAAAPPIISSS
jgi:hypothetical protein